MTESIYKSSTSNVHERSLRRNIVRMQLREGGWISRDLNKEGHDRLSIVEVKETMFQSFDLAIEKSKLQSVSSLSSTQTMKRDGELEEDEVKKDDQE